VSTTLHPSSAESRGFIVIDAGTVAQLVTLQESLELAEAALRKTSDGRALQDIRRTLPLPGDPGTCLSLMYASLGDQAHFGAKVQSVFPLNFQQGRPSHQGGVMLFDRDGGVPVALINASAVTALRTPAASAVATRLLARPDASDLAILGYGDQAARHIAALSAVRSIARIRVWGRDAVKCRDFAEAQSALGFPTEAMATAEAAVDGADIVCTVTSASSPVLAGDWLAPGCHINAVGASVAALQEIDLACVTRSSIWVDYMPMALTAAADIFEPLAEGIIAPSRIIGEIGAVLNGQAPGRTSKAEITLYRSLGVPAQDIELASFIYHKARALGLGTEVSL
jgi:ornithine cyclodeaminase/alanine dehydrogenase-like protein (mu-crystallin family)